MRRCLICNVLRSVQSVVNGFTLFNLEGTGKDVPKDVEDGYGGLAQLGERLPCKQEVSGSIPLISTIWARSSAG